MYDNIGNKIKILAKIVCLLGIIGSVVFGLIVCFGTGEFRVIGLLYVLIGSIMSCISSFITYGFGELIEKVCSIEKKVNTSTSIKTVKQKNNLLPINKLVGNTICEEQKIIEDEKEKSSVEHRWRCNYCGEMISEDICPHCGNQH